MDIDIEIDTEKEIDTVILIETDTVSGRKQALHADVQQGQNPVGFYGY